MGIFKDKATAPSFKSRSEAFDYMLSDLISKGEDMMKAAEKANAFAEIVATNKSLPNTSPVPLNTMERVVSYIKMAAQLKKDNPEVWDLLTGALGGLVSGFAVLTTNTPPSTVEQTYEKIDFDKLE